MKFVTELRWVASIPDDEFNVLIGGLAKEGRRAIRSEVVRYAKQRASRSDAHDQVSLPLHPGRAAEILTARLSYDQRVELALLLVEGLEDLITGRGSTPPLSGG
jgi:hypothetical protein